MYLTLDKLKLAYKMPIKYFEDGITLSPFEDLQEWIQKHQKAPYFNNSAYPRGVNMLYDLGSFSFNNNAVLWEFNPNKIQFNDRFLETELVMLNSVHEWHDTKDKHFTRLDIALDLDIEINAYNWFYEGTAYKDTIEKNNTVETLYLGSRQSDTMFRIYDKEKECKANDLLLPKHMENYKHKTRIELEWKKDKKPTLEDIKGCFDKLLIIPKSTTFMDIQKVCDDIQDSLTLAHVIEKNMYYLIEEMPRRQKERLKQILKKIDVSSTYTNLLEKINYNDIICKIDKFYNSLNIFDLYDLPF